MILVGWPVFGFACFNDLQVKGFSPCSVRLVETPGNRTFPPLSKAAQMAFINPNNGWSRAAKASARKSAKGLGRYSVLRFTKNHRKSTGISYREYIASDSWAAKKQQFLESDLPKTCLVCNSSEIELHHVTYRRLGYEFLSDLVPLCRKCHKKTHKLDREAGDNDLAGLSKSLVYDFNIGTEEVDAIILPFHAMRQKEQREAKRPRKRKPRFAD